jgi:hypothetical protein|uniref:Uncharacterized protein n=1 Tax=viral metagenome TaxID=1070528 RepID=A0A6C0CKK4_9ZZZZ
MDYMKFNPTYHIKNIRNIQSLRLQLRYNNFLNVINNSIKEINSKKKNK